MYNFKKVLAMVLAVVMMLSVASVAFATNYADHDSEGKYAASPTKGDTTTYALEYSYGGITTERHKDGTAISYKDRDESKSLNTPMITDVAAAKAGTLVTVAGVFIGLDDDWENKNYVKWVCDVPGLKEGDKGYWDKENGHWEGGKIVTAEVQQIGSGSYGIGANDNGANVTGLSVKSKAPLVTVASKALADSKIANIVIDADNVQINKNVTKGTKAKTIAFAFPQMTKSKQLVVKKGAFNGAKKVRIVVSPKMTSKELKKLKKRLKKALGAAAYKKVKIVRG